MNNEIRTYINDSIEHTILFDNPEFDDAIIGISTDDRVVYDYELMVNILVDRDNMSIEDAMDFISYDTIRTLGYINDECKPIIYYPIP